VLLDHDFGVQQGIDDQHPSDLVLPVERLAVGSSGAGARPAPAGDTRASSPSCHPQSQLHVLEGGAGKAGAEHLLLRNEQERLIETFEV